MPSAGSSAAPKGSAAAKQGPLAARVIDASGKVIGKRRLPDALFGGEPNEAVVHQVITAQRAAARSGTASTKTRSRVSGGGTKPWRQKGTGRARHGSIRSPMWVGGGVVFGPKPRDHSIRVNKKMRKTALRSLLASKASEGRVWILGGFEEGRTKAARSCLESAGIGGRVLLVMDPMAENARSVDRAFRNLDKSAFALYGSLAAFDVAVADAVLFTAEAFERYAGGEEQER